MIRFHRNDRHGGEDEKVRPAPQCGAERVSALARGLWSSTKTCTDDRRQPRYFLEIWPGSFGSKLVQRNTSRRQALPLHLSV
jgi:hypothetical protein